MTKSKISKLMKRYLKIQEFKYPSITCSIVYNPKTKTYVEVSKRFGQDKWDEVYDEFKSLDEVEEYLKETIEYHDTFGDSPEIEVPNIIELNKVAKDNWW